MRQATTRYLGLAAVLAGMLVTAADARWKPEYANAPQAVQDWYKNAELTSQARLRFPFKNCCEHADVVKTQFRVNKATTGDEWYWLDGEVWRRVPDDIIHWGKTAPSKQPTLFVYAGKETCFWPGEFANLADGTPTAAAQASPAKTNPSGLDRNRPVILPCIVPLARPRSTAKTQT